MGRLHWVRFAEACLRIGMGWAVRGFVAMAVSAGFATGVVVGGPHAAATINAAAAAVPLFRDPVHDGAADPVVVWNRA